MAKTPLFPECLDRENAPNHVSAVRMWQGILVMTGLNPRQAHDGDWGDQTDVTTAMLQNDLGLSTTYKLDALTRAAILGRYKIDLSSYTVEDCLPEGMSLIHDYAARPPFLAAKAEPSTADANCALEQD